MVRSRILLTLVLSALSLSNVYSNDEDTKLEINRIKKSADYIYAESTASTLDDAKAYAEEQLYESINKWVASQRSQNTRRVAKDTRASWQVLSMPRGSNMHRCFIYVPKAKVLSASAPEAETPKAETPKAAAPKAAVPVQQVVAQAAPQYPAEVLELAAIQDYSVMTSKIKALYSQGKIEHYARYASLQNPERYYLVIYNREGKVVTVLTPGAERLNVKTNQKDGVQNYVGCGAIGFVLK